MHYFFRPVTCLIVFLSMASIAIFAGCNGGDPVVPELSRLTQRSPQPLEQDVTLARSIELTFTPAVPIELMDCEACRADDYRALGLQLLVFDPVTAESVAGQIEIEMNKIRFVPTENWLGGTWYEVNFLWQPERLMMTPDENPASREDWLELNWRFRTTGTREIALSLPEELISFPAVVGRPFRLRPIVSGETGGRFEVVGALPSWANLDSSNGEITGTPTAAHIGTTDVSIRVFARGGRVTETTPFSIVVDDAIRSITTLPSGRAGSGSALLGNDWFIFGGAADLSGGGGLGASVREVLKIDTAAPAGTPPVLAGSLPIIMLNASVVRVGTKAYIFGGFADIDRLYIYDLETGALELDDELIELGSENYFETCTDGMRIYSFGLGAANDEVWMFDVAASSWSVLATGVTPPENSGSCIVDTARGDIVMVGTTGWHHFDLTDFSVAEFSPAPSVGLAFAGLFSTPQGIVVAGGASIVGGVPAANNNIARWDRTVAGGSYEILGVFPTPHLLATMALGTGGRELFSAGGVTSFAPGPALGTVTGHFIGETDYGPRD